MCEQHSGGCQGSMAKLVLRRGSDNVASIQHEDKYTKTQPTSVGSVVQSSCYFNFRGHPATAHLHVKNLFWPLFSCGYILDQYHLKPGFFSGSPYCYIHRIFLYSLIHREYSSGHSS